MALCPEDEDAEPLEPGDDGAGALYVGCEGAEPPPCPGDAAAPPAPNPIKLANIAPVVALTATA